MDDKIEAWLDKTVTLISNYTASICDADERFIEMNAKPAWDALMAHLRTTPEGFVLVPVIKEVCAGESRRVCLHPQRSDKCGADAALRGIGR